MKIICYANDTSLKAIKFNLWHLLSQNNIALIWLSLLFRTLIELPEMEFQPNVKLVNNLWTYLNANFIDEEPNYIIKFLSYSLLTKFL